MLKCQSTIIWILICVAVSHALLGSSFTAKPSNMVTYVGKPMKMECGVISNSLTLWYFQDGRINTSRILLHNGKTFNRKLNWKFAIDDGTVGSRDLMTPATKLEYAGIYECFMLHSNSSTVSGVSSKAQLIVLASDPLCESNMSANSSSVVENESLALSCSIGYNGIWSPVMQWFKQGAEVSSELYRDDSSGSRNLISTLIVKVNSSDNGVIFSCKTFFAPDSNSFGINATNVPDYVYQWNITVRVEYGPRHVTITPVMEYYEIGSQLRCNADANPKPDYEWRYRDASLITNGSDLFINMPFSQNNQEYTLECIAGNLVSGSRQVGKKQVTIKIKEWTLVSGYVFGVLGAVGGIICTTLAFIIPLLLRRRKMEVHQKEEQSRQEQTYSALTGRMDDQMEAIYTGRPTPLPEEETYSHISDVRIEVVYENTQPNTSRELIDD